MLKEKIFFVIPYLAKPPFEERRDERIYRERRMVSLSQAYGFDTRLFLLSYGKAVVQEQREIASWLLPTSEGRQEDPFSHVAYSLLDIVEAEQPGLVIVKGFGHALTRWLMLRTRHRFRLALIAAGGTIDPVSPFVDYVFAETPSQIQDRFQSFQALGRVSILPKLNLPGIVPLSALKEFDVINVGGFNKNKNQQALLPLATDYRLALVGDGERWQAIKEMATSFGESVFMPGNLPREQVGPLIAKSRLMVHPAHHEGLARVVMEAFAVGVPVVASRRAMPNAFEHGVQGLLVEPDQILGAARELLEDPDRLEAMGKAAKELASRRCTEQAVFTEIQKMYDVVLNAPPVFTGSWSQILRIRWRTAVIRLPTVLRAWAIALGAKRFLAVCGIRP